MTYSYRDLSVVLTVKDSLGRTIENVTSVEFSYAVSDDDLLDVGQQGEASQGATQPAEPGLEAVTLPGKGQ